MPLHQQEIWRFAHLCVAQKRKDISNHLKKLSINLKGTAREKKMKTAAHHLRCRPKREKKVPHFKLKEYGTFYKVESKWSRKPSRTLRFNKRDQSGHVQPYNIAQTPHSNWQEWRRKTYYSGSCCSHRTLAPCSLCLPTYSSVRSDVICPTAKAWPTQHWTMIPNRLANLPADGKRKESTCCNVPVAKHRPRLGWYYVAGFPSEYAQSSTKWIGLVKKTGPTLFNSNI